MGATSVIFSIAYIFPGKHDSVALAIGGGNRPRIPQPPLSNRPGSFPKKYLASNEVLLFESQPTFNLLAFPGAMTYFILIVMLFLGVALVAATSLGPGSSVAVALTEGLVASIPIAIIVILVLLIRYSYRKTHYALTDQRIILIKGVIRKTVLSVEHDYITAVQVSQPFLLNRFGLGNLEFSAPSLAHSTVLWFNIRDPQETHAYIMDIRQALEYYKQRGATLAQAAMVGNAVAANVAPTKRCWNCGETIPSPATFCRNCGSRQP